ncbi:hypothetical protein [Okeania sp. KiyG1]|uniref:hypothetical protein n=1 Tax=Okeania sp. KiyG1 TaxID=2720165 RepID=UPI001922C7D3|nr:hypothetical protein [Okeania sp. KiyG1]
MLNSVEIIIKQKQKEITSRYRIVSAKVRKKEDGRRKDGREEGTLSICPLELVWGCGECGDCGEFEELAGPYIFAHWNSCLRKRGSIKDGYFFSKDSSLTSATPGRDEGGKKSWDIPAFDLYRIIKV